MANSRETPVDLTTDSGFRYVIKEVETGSKDKDVLLSSKPLIDILEALIAELKKPNTAVRRLPKIYFDKKSPPTVVIATMEMVEKRVSALSD